MQTLRNPLSYTRRTAFVVPLASLLFVVGAVELSSAAPIANQFDTFTLDLSTPDGTQPPGYTFVGTPLPSSQTDGFYRNPHTAGGQTVTDPSTPGTAVYPGDALDDGAILIFGNNNDDNTGINKKAVLHTFTGEVVDGAEYAYTLYFHRPYPSSFTKTLVSLIVDLGGPKEETVMAVPTAASSQLPVPTLQTLTISYTGILAHDGESLSMRVTSERESAGASSVLGIDGWELSVIDPNGGGTPGDFDNDEDVDGFDFLVWQRGDSPDPLSATDLATWESNYPSPPSGFSGAATAVPEPGSVTMLLLGAVMAPLARRRRRAVVHSSINEKRGARMASNRFWIGLAAIGILGASASVSSAVIVVRDVDNPLNDAEEHINPNPGVASDDNTFGYVEITSTDIEIGSESEIGIDWQAVGLQFHTLGIPKGSTINSATLNLIVENSVDGPGITNAEKDMTIYAEAIGDSPTFESTFGFTPNFNLTSRERSSASVGWTLPGSNTVSPNQSINAPDLSPLIQETVNRSDWAPNNQLALLIFPDIYLAHADPNDPASFAGRFEQVTEIEFVSYDGAPSLAPRLTVDFTPPPPTVAVPEPASVMLGLIGLAVLSSPRGRRVTAFRHGRKKALPRSPGRGP